MSLSAIKDTRYFAKKRAIILAVFLLMLASLFTVTSLLAAENPSTSPAGIPSPSTHAELLTINTNELFQLVNESGVEFVRSVSNVTYYIVTSTSSTQVRGLVYLTTDVALDWTYGYNSYVSVLVFVNRTGTIESLKPWHTQESWGYAFNDSWLNRFVGHSVYEPLEIGNDVDGITSATYTSKAISEGVRESGRIVVDDYDAKECGGISSLERFLGVTFAAVRLDDLIEATGTLTVFCVALFAYRRNDERLKYMTIATVILFLGIYTGRMVSIIDLTQLMWGALPTLFSNFYWCALFGSMLATSLILGRLYCGCICPFGAFIEIAHDISPIKKKIPIKAHSRLVYVKYPILVEVAVGVLSGSSWITGIEPFQTLFRLRGDWWMWIVMAGAVIISTPH